MNESEVPVKVGELYDVSINAVGGKGDGIAKVKGFVLFVANAKKGDYVRVKVTKVLPKVGFAEIKEVLEKPLGGSKYASVSKQEMEQEKEEPSQKYDETDDFGAELDEK
jgi:predicted RNA-binding protein with TRAM domain